jgi:16S rRNA (guanine966-N2)-methyltransferase
MRVVAGELGGRRLVVPTGSGTRPTSELVREAVFNSLEARGLVVGAAVADLFAGSGALGIEALSRGADAVVFVESSRRAARAIQENVTALGLAGRALLRPVTVERWLVERCERAADAGPPERLDLALVDPPYSWDGWETLLEGLAASGVGLVVAESDRPVGAPGWDVVGLKRHGGTVVSQLRPRGACRL